jgi:hypothetical protein
MNIGYLFFEPPVAFSFVLLVSSVLLQNGHNLLPQIGKISLVFMLLTPCTLCYHK